MNSFLSKRSQKKLQKSVKETVEEPKTEKHLKSTKTSQMEWGKHQTAWNPLANS